MISNIIIMIIKIEYDFNIIQKYFRPNLLYISMLESWNLTSVNCFHQLCYLLYLHPMLTHSGLVMPYGDIDLGQHWFR